LPGETNLKELGGREEGGSRRGGGGGKESPREGAAKQKQTEKANSGGVRNPTPKEGIGRRWRWVGKE